MNDVRIDLLPPEIATWLVVLMAVAAFAFWVGVRWVTHRFRGRVPRWAVVLPRTLTAVAAAWFLFQVIGRLVTYACVWPVWVAALLMGLGVESVVACLYRERQVLSPRQGNLVLLLRSTAVALVALILMQPVLIRSTDKRITRRVAVLIDGSASMRFVDQQWTPRERMQWATHAGLIEMAQASSLTNAATDVKACWEALPATVQETVRTQCETTRVALASRLLMRSPLTAPAFLETLASRYDLDVFTFGRGLRRSTEDEIKNGMDTSGEPSFSEHAFQGATDLALALEGVLQEIPSEQLAGVLLLSDGIHNADTALLPVTRRLAAQGVPVSSVKIGGTQVAFDVALADVVSPESVFLGDRVRMTATLRATGAMGRKVKVALFCETQLVETQEVEIASNTWQQEIRFAHEPLSQGVVRYELRVEPLEGELFAENNRWQTDVAVSDDRINVLLVDHTPRWEFRYLRNLFFGRDKSVHLQSWLVKPDKLEGVTDMKLPPAAASRKFGDAESGGWPQSREAWRAFDVIILGDLDEATLTPQVQEELRSCVVDRGALLVVIVGPRAMPHAFAPDSLLAELVPFTVQKKETFWQSPETAYRLSLTPSGQTHPVMVQSSSLTENEAVWSALPLLDWRLPVIAKPGAEILAVAAPEGGESEQVLTDVRQAVEYLDAVMQQRARHALIVAQQVGRGKVLGLALDQTWRLRYRIGDMRHHRFWGQVMRWGLGERLRAGHEQFRAGTDRLVYGPEESITVMARVLNESYAGIDNARLEAILRQKDGTEVTRVVLNPRADSHGFYEATLPPQTQAGAFQVVVVRLDTEAREQVETSLLVTASRRPIEMGTVSPSLETLEALAKGTGGRVVSPDQLSGLGKSFGEGRGMIKQRREIALWNTPYVLLALALLLTTEWAVRKKNGVA